MTCACYARLVVVVLTLWVVAVGGYSSLAVKFNNHIVTMSTVTGGYKQEEDATTEVSEMVTSVRRR